MTPTTRYPALGTWPRERRAEVNNSTAENPVQLTLNEEKEMREQSPHILQHAVGVGRLKITIREDSKADKALKLKDKGLSNAAIAAELGLAESSVRTILDRSI